MIIKLGSAAINTEEILYMIPSANGQTKVVFKDRDDFTLNSDLTVDEILEKIAAAKG